MQEKRSKIKPSTLAYSKQGYFSFSKIYREYYKKREEVWLNPKKVPEIILKQTIDLYESEMKNENNW